MQNTKTIIEKSLSELADEREAQALGRSAAAIAGAMVNVGLAVSAFLTIFYLTVLVDAAIRLPDPWGVIFGLLVGVVAVVPAEMGMVVWRARLAADAQITTGQRATAIIAMIFAGLFAALTTSSFFSYFLPQLFPQSYLAVAPALNVSAIVGAWVVFIMAIVAYSVFSRQTQQNLAQASAYQRVFDARMVVLKSAGEAIRLEAESMVKEMNERGIFRGDAQQLILTCLGMDASRLSTPVLPPQHEHVPLHATPQPLHEPLHTPLHAPSYEPTHVADDAAQPAHFAEQFEHLPVHSFDPAWHGANGANFTRRP